MCVCVFVRLSWPSSVLRATLRQSYIYGYANLPIPEPRTRKHASEAVKNIKKKKTGQIKVRRAVCLRTLHSNPPTGCVHEAVSQYVADQAS